MPYAVNARRAAAIAGLSGAILLMSIALPAVADARTYVPCSKRGGVSMNLKVKPLKCDFTYLHNPFALAGRAISLKWRGWGRRVARARGTGVSIRADENGHFDRFPVRVRLSRRVACRGRQIYTRVTMIEQDDTRTWSVPRLRC